VKPRSTTIERNTSETQIKLSLDLSSQEPIEIDLGVPFFEHMLHALAFHGGFSLAVRGRGDLEVDPHHLVEDVGLVLGSAFARIVEESGHIARFGHAVIAMDDALSEATIDACGRPYLVYEATYPQTRSGAFDMSLIREFLWGFAGSARINLHAVCRYGENSHHMAEALFKAVGKSLKEAYRPIEGGAPLSTKGSLGQSQYHRKD